ncbi:plus-3-domain-containing protein, partial [Phellopilus nigrolimitatus]
NARTSLLNIWRKCSTSRTNAISIRCCAHSARTTCLKAAKRAHQVRGATKEKTCKLDVLKAKRKAKSEKKRVRCSLLVRILLLNCQQTMINSPKRKHSSSPMDMEISSEDEEDRQISRLEQQEERESRLLNKTKPEDEDLTMEDLEKCRLSRSKLVKYALMPWFEDFVKGNLPDILSSLKPFDDQGQPVYRICEIANLGSNPAKPYKIENEYFDTRLELRHGAGYQSVPDGQGFQRGDEWHRIKATCEHEKVKLPAKRTIEKLQQFAKLTSHLLTEADIPAILARKAELNHSLPKTRTTETKAALERAELVRMRVLAQMHRDFAESAALDTRQGAVRKGGHPHEGERAQPTGEPQRCAPHGGYEAEAERRKKTRLTRAASATGSRPGTPGVFNVSPQGLAERDADARRVACARGRHAFRVAPPSQKGVLGKRVFESIVASSVEVDLVDF